MSKYKQLWRQLQYFKYLLEYQKDIKILRFLMILRICWSVRSLMFKKVKIGLFFWSASWINELTNCVANFLNPFALSRFKTHQQKLLQIKEDRPHSVELVSVVVSLSLNSPGSLAADSWFIHHTVDVTSNSVSIFHKTAISS